MADLNTPGSQSRNPSDFEALQKQINELKEALEAQKKGASAPENTGEQQRELTDKEKKAKETAANLAKGWGSNDENPYKEDEKLREKALKEE